MLKRGCYFGYRASHVNGKLYEPFTSTHLMETFKCH
jgi:hypothetical protein